MVAEGGLVLGGWQVVHDDGAVLACAVNAAAAALVDAGVAMRGLVSAVCLTLTPSLTVLLDPVASELAVRLVRQTLRIQPI
jgi:ribonuclease PH